MTTVHDPVREQAIARANAGDDTADLLRAAKAVIETSNASWKTLQRREWFSQATAERLLLELERHGVIGPEIAGHRRVIPSPGDLKATLKRLEAELRQPSPPTHQPATSQPPAPLATATTSPPASPTSAGTSDHQDPTSDPDASAGGHIARGGLGLDDDPLVDAGDDHQDDAGGELEPHQWKPPAQRQPAEVAELDDDLDPPSPPRRRVTLNAVKRQGTWVVDTVRRGDHPLVKVLRGIARYIWMTGKGFWSWTCKAGRAVGQVNAREQVAMARNANASTQGRFGMLDELERWGNHLEKLHNNRSKRQKDWPARMKAAFQVVSVGLVLVLLVAPLVVGALAWVAWGSAGWNFWWWFANGAGHVIAGLVVLVVELAILLAPLVTLWAAHREGMRVGDPPRWLLSLDERRGIGVEITPARVAMALRDCGIPALNRHIKESIDGGGDLLGPITIAGRGMEVDVKPPATVSTDIVQGKRRRIAEALDRYEHELYMTIVGARTLRFWIADPGVLDEPIGPSPLVVAGPKAIKANMQTGKAPAGENLRGDPVGVSLWQRHWLVTGLSNHGKTKVGRALALWLAYDVKTEFRIGDLKGTDNDWGMFGPINGAPGLASVYIAGPTDEHVIQVVEMLEGVVEEMERRIASGSTDWDPLVAIVDEAQVAFMCPAVGPDKRPYGGSKNTSRFFMACRRIENQGRVVNVTLGLLTQDPTDQNLPVLVREAFHIRIACVLGTPSQSRMALGEAAVDGGAAPHLLRRDIDKGTVVMHGGVELPRGESSITARWHYIDDQEAWALAKGAIEKRRRAGRTPLVIDAAPVVVDHLEDIRIAMRGENKVRTVVLLGRLIEENPAVYEPWGSDDLANALREYAHLGLDIRKSDGQSVVRLTEVEQALRERG